MGSLNTYRVEKDEQNHPFLVAESSVEYGKLRVNGPEEAVNLVNDVFRLKYLAEESVCLISLDSACGVIGLFKVSQGTVNRSICNPREIFIRALVSGASSIIVIHNHPSGDSSPSDQDILACERLSQAANIMGIQLSDFIIIGDTHHSFREKNEMSLI